MSKTADHIREAALGDAPNNQCRNATAWVGMDRQWKVLVRLMPGEIFYAAKEDAQRTFLLFVAESMS